MQATLNTLPSTIVLARALRRPSARAAALMLAGLATLASSAASAQSLPFHHPAVASTVPTQTAGYDYASKFYRHPAGLDLAPTYGPHAGGEHPAVLARRTEAGYDYASKFYPHPAGLALASTYPVHAGDHHPAVRVQQQRAAAGGDAVPTAVALHPALAARGSQRLAAAR